ncbi:hypothetical protein JW905_04680, partial [bacterium]|nr:hypothetical protein [candidate division CSSED10-310 bacterium]
FLLVYCFYFGFGQTTSVYNSRYLLPSWPPLIILSLYGLRLAGCVQTRYVRWAGAAIMSALHLYLVVPTTYLELQAVRPWKLVLARTIDALRSAPEEFPPGLRLFASPAVLLQLQVAFGDRFVFMPAPVGTGRTLKEFRSNGEAPAGQLEQMDVRGRVEISYNGLLRSLEKNEGTRALLVSSITPPPTVAGHSGMLTIETLWQTADDGAHLGIYGLNYQAKPAM